MIRLLIDYRHVQTVVKHSILPIGGMAAMIRDDEECKVKEDDVQEMNPPRYYQCKDMANLIYLDEGPQRPIKG